MEHLPWYGNQIQQERNGQVWLSIFFIYLIFRRLFERVINMKFSSKKMKFFFKKYLDFEKMYGDEVGIENVKTAAQAYVQKMQE